MASVNKVIILGNVGNDPDIRFLPSGESVANFSLATSETWKDKNSGEKKEATEWHRCSAFGKLAEIIGQYVKKGSSIYVEGSLKTRKWQDKDGSDRYTTEIRVDQMTMLGGKSDRATANDQAGTTASDYAKATGKDAPPANKQTDGGFGAMDDDIPFAPIGRKMGMLS